MTETTDQAINKMRDTYSKYTHEHCAPGKFNVGQMNDAEAINFLVMEVHESNLKAGWWNDQNTGESLTSNPVYTPYVIATKLLLGISEIIEAVEGYRKDEMDDKLPHRPMVEVELADAVIRLFDLAGVMGLDLGGAFVEKRAFNATRKDHKVENRAKKGGKRF
jgi:NTP pyrophosphatase (non-canonical NTP hydrolase)